MQQQGIVAVGLHSSLKNVSKAKESNDAEVKAAPKE
jgi:hypothetical protein